MHFFEFFRRVQSWFVIEDIEEVSDKPPSLLDSPPIVLADNTILELINQTLDTIRSSNNAALKITELRRLALVVQYVDVLKAKGLTVLEDIVTVIQDLLTSTSQSSLLFEFTIFTMHSLIVKRDFAVSNNLFLQVEVMSNPHLVVSPYPPLCL